MIKVALAGNPNCGKTTLFNSLTGSSAYVGNWPGVTVEKRSGTYKGKKGSEPMDIVDLPGVYSLSPYTPEEIVARSFILDERPDVIIDVIDSTNLERNLYLTTQLMEVDIPVVVALNMADALEKEGQRIDTDELSSLLGFPVVAISALRERNLSGLMGAAEKAASTKRIGKSLLSESKYKDAIANAAAIYRDNGFDNALFRAIKALENDEIEKKGNPLLVSKCQTLLDDEAAGAFEDESSKERYRLIEESFSKARRGRKNARTELSRSDKADRVLASKWFAIPIFIAVLLLIFELTFSEDLFFLHRFGVDFTPVFEGNRYFEGIFWSAKGISSPGTVLASFVEGVTGWLSDLIRSGLTSLSAPDWTIGLVMSIVSGGFFAILNFLPQVLCLYFFFSFLEDCGYMSRVAFVFDRIFRRAGLSGRAFIPMLMGYGCGVPAMVNARSLNTEKERITTIRVIPFFCCGAKVASVDAIAAILASSMFGWNAALVGFSMYLLGLILAIGMVILQHWTTMREKTPPFIMELPPYHMPQFKSLMLHLWDKIKDFLKKASTIIVLAALLVWITTSFNWQWQYIPSISSTPYEGSILKSLCQAVSPIFYPLGFGNNLAGEGWVMTLASALGLVAKEMVADTFYAVAGSQEGFLSLIQAMNISVGGLVAFMVFNLTTVPCFASVATARAELPKGTLYRTIAFWLVSSYVFGLIARLIFDFTWTLAIIIPAIALIFVLAYLHYRRAYKKEESANPGGRVN